MPGEDYTERIVIPVDSDSDLSDESTDIVSEVGRG